MFKLFIITYIEKRIAQLELAESKQNDKTEIVILIGKRHELKDLIQIINNFKD